MADDEKVVKPEAPSFPSPPPAIPGQPASRRDPSSEWTASDERGPLGTADERRATGAPPSAEPIEDAPAEAASPSSIAGAIAATPPETAGVTATGSASSHEPTEPATHDEPESAGSNGVIDAPTLDEPRKRSLWPVAAGIIVGAVIGAGSAAIVYGTGSGGGGQNAQLASLTARLDALEKRSDVATVESSVAALDKKVAALATASGQAGTGSSSVDLSPLQKQVAALQAQVETTKSQGAQTSDLDAKIAALEGAVAGMQKDASSAQAGVQTVEGQQKTIAVQQKLLADKVMVPALAVVADSLVQQIQSGEPYAAQVAALETLDADPAKIAILKQNADRGVLSAKALAAKFAPLAEPISATAHKAAPNAGFVDRLKSGMLSMVSVRSVDDMSGNDPASRAARIKADLAHDDVADALATWNALPPDAKAKGGEDWSLLAKAHAEAMGAARALQHDAIVALGAKKS